MLVVTTILTIIIIIHTKNIIAAVGMIILMNITNMSILTRTVTAAARTNIRTSIIMNTANVAVTKRSIRRTIMRATKIFCTTEKICPTS